MQESNEERLKKIIEAKKSKGEEKSGTQDRATKKVGNAHKAFKSNKRGGFFDK